MATKQFFHQPDESNYYASFGLITKNAATGKVGGAVAKGEKLIVTPTFSFSGSYTATPRQIQYNLGTYLTSSSITTKPIQKVTTHTANPIVVYGYRNDPYEHTDYITATATLYSNNSGQSLGTITEKVQYTVKSEADSKVYNSYYTYFPSKSSYYMIGDKSCTYYNDYSKTLTYTWHHSSLYLGNVILTPGTKSLAYAKSTTVFAEVYSTDTVLSYSFAVSSSAVSAVKTASDTLKVTLTAGLTSPSAVVVSCTAKTLNGLTSTGSTTISLKKKPVPAPVSYYTYYASEKSYYVYGDSCYTYYNAFNNTLTYFNVVMPQPTIQFIKVVGPSAISYGDTAVFTASALSSNGGAIIYDWSLNSPGMVKTQINGDKISITNVANITTDTRISLVLSARTPGSKTYSFTKKIILKPANNKGIDPAVFNAAYYKINNAFDNAKKEALAALETLRP